MDGTRRLFRAYFKTVAESRVPFALGRFFEFQNATFRYGVPNECKVLRGTQPLVLSMSDLEDRISDPGTQLNIRLVAETPSNDLA